MKNLIYLLVSAFLIASCYSQTKIADEKLKYLGETPPGIKAKLFHDGELVQREDGQKRSFNLAFSPAGDELFFSYYKGTEKKPHPEYVIMTYKLIDKKWIGPKVASFSGKYSDVDVNFSPDGNYIFYSSDRIQPHSIGLDIYYSVKTPAGWTEPIYAGTDVNTVEGEVYPSVSKKGNLFFRSSRKGGYGNDDLYRAKWKNGNFVEVQNLGPKINTINGESNSVIAPDESYILFCSTRPEDGNIQQIYVSYQIGDNEWTEAKKLSPEVNTEAGAGAPTISPDGKYLFFKKSKGNERGLYWISTDIIKKQKKLLP